MRFRKRILEGLKRARGVAGEGEGEGAQGKRNWELVSRGDRGAGDGDGGRGKLCGEHGAAMGFERSDVLRRRTGPGPSSDSAGSSERSAMSQGLVCSGAASRAESQGSWSKACGPRSARIWGRRRRGAGLVRRREGEEQVGTRWMGERRRWMPAGCAA